MHVCVFGEGECACVRVNAYMRFRAGLYVTRMKTSLRQRNAEHNDTVECEYLRERQYTMLRLSSTFLSVYPCICVNSLYCIYSCYQLPACACVCVCVFEQYVCVINITHAPLVFSALRVREDRGRSDSIELLFRESGEGG